MSRASTRNSDRTIRGRKPASRRSARRAASSATSCPARAQRSTPTSRTEAVCAANWSRRKAPPERVDGFPATASGPEGPGPSAHRTRAPPAHQERGPAAATAALTPALQQAVQFLQPVFDLGRCPRSIEADRAGQPQAACRVPSTESPGPDRPASRAELQPDRVGRASILRTPRRAGDQPQSVGLQQSARRRRKSAEPIDQLLPQRVQARTSSSHEASFLYSEAVAEHRDVVGRPATRAYAG